MKKILLARVLAAAAPAFGATLEKLDDHKVTFFDISSTATTPFGVQIRVKGNAACLVASEFLHANNISGIDLVRSLTTGKSYSEDWVVVCEPAPGVFEGYQAIKIRPRDEP
jgi:hypothetical protein